MAISTAIMNTAAPTPNGDRSPVVRRSNWAEHVAARASAFQLAAFVRPIVNRSPIREIAILAGGTNGIVVK